MTNATKQETICRIQGVLMSMTIGITAVKFGTVVTRWAKDAFEVGTWGKSGGIGSESAAEQIVCKMAA